jgi:hypothetical protein
MNDYIMLNLFRQREKEILKELENNRFLKALHAGGRKKRKETCCRLKSIVVPWKRGACHKASRAREWIDPLRLRDQTMQHHPEL